MTLVCVRLDESYSTPRLTALADTRATIERPDKSVKVVSDTTVKLFAIPIRCYSGDCLVPTIGAWENPYHETTIGLGFSGNCFEGLTVIAHISQCLGALMAPDGGEPKPSKDGLVNYIAKIKEGYFAQHKGGYRTRLEMVIFGYEDGRPWIGTTKWDSDKVNSVSATVEFAKIDDLISIGEYGVFKQYADEWRNRIQKHKTSRHLPRARNDLGDGDALFEHSVEIDRHDLAVKKITEEGLLREIEADYAETIGGVLQRLEIGLDNGKVVAGFTMDARPYLQRSSFTVADGAVLTSVPIVETMGRQIPQPFNPST